MLRHAGVVGDPAGHSLSPAIHRAGYAANDLDWAYEAYTVAPAELDAFVGERLDDPAWAGLSVTAPHKEAILAFGEADEPTRLARKPPGPHRRGPPRGDARRGCRPLSGRTVDRTFVAPLPGQWPAPGAQGNH